MFRAVVEGFRTSWKPLVQTDVLFKLTAFVLLAPIVSWLFRGFLALSGRSILADTDIAAFLLHPIGWLAGITVGGGIIAILALEQAVLMLVYLSANSGRPVSIRDSLKFTAGKAPGIFQITARMVMKILLLSAPFLAAGGALYLLFLTDHDINYYLAEKPPKFYIAAGLIAAILLVLAILVIRAVVNWSVAIPLYLFGKTSPRDSLSQSRDRVHGNRVRITRWIVAWILINAAISSLASGAVLWLARWIVPAMTGAIWQLVLALGGTLAVWGLVNFVTSLVAVISFAIILAQVYEQFGKGADSQLPDALKAASAGPLKWTTGRIAAILAVAVALAALIGALAIQTVRFEDDVEITAHRGGAVHAPENTLAAIRRAIEDKTDWVEIDVQESKDGVVMVAHDSDLMKVSGTNTKIWEGTAEELGGIDIGSYFGPEFAGERVPTLEEVLKACKGKTRVNIELKYYGHNQNLEQKVIDLVEKHGMAKDIVIMSLKAEGIAKIKSLRPAWTVGLLTATAVGDLTRADADFLAVNTSLATRSFINRAHRNGKDVYVWTVNDSVAMSRMISRGADNRITDDPALARRVLKERAELSPVERVLLDFALRFGMVPEAVAE